MLMLSLAGVVGLVGEEEDGGARSLCTVCLLLLASYSKLIVVLLGSFGVGGVLCSWCSW